MIGRLTLFIEKSPFNPSPARLSRNNVIPVSYICAISPTGSKNVPLPPSASLLQGCWHPLTHPGCMPEMYWRACTCATTLSMTLMTVQLYIYPNLSPGQAAANCLRLLVSIHTNTSGNQNLGAFFHCASNLAFVSTPVSSNGPKIVNTFSFGCVASRSWGVEVNAPVVS